MNAIATVEDVEHRARRNEAPEPAMAGGLFAQEETRGSADAVAF